ncbi:hypothetical protein MUU77_07235 [Pseudoxanthomonas sp. F37]|uniref:hypothetical protein n=1 Tax=Pseudoxanthomonas TaxID=83618 RepID=UPI001FCFD88E|nr:MULTISPECIES: hypothetical protein [Pseudoxanthomonas]UOV05060.1 hypothetical protein MUU75_18675 [Pseudoxanthomonas mexicana]UOV10066.1 hypothetical protein MUU77_07235 [Pseudoxanthomonas sp. F37]
MRPSRTTTTASAKGAASGEATTVARSMAQVCAWTAPAIVYTATRHASHPAHLRRIPVSTMRPAGRQGSLGHRGASAPAR